MPVFDYRASFDSLRLEARIVYRLFFDMENVNDIATMQMTA